MDSKTKIFGEHDAATIKQIETCVATGGERGVLCADGHKGYVQPIGELKSIAAEQLGTVGGGNHYVDIFADEQERIWVGVHFGSRGLGHKTATHFLKAAGGREGMDVPPTVIDEKSEIGHDYLAGM